MGCLNIVIDGRTMRLIRLAQGVQLMDALPKESAKRVLGLARAVRLFAEAGEPEFAVTVTTSLQAYIDASDEADLSALFKPHCDSVRRALLKGVIS